MKYWIATFAAAFLMQAATPAQATTFMLETFTCPIGGETFTEQVPASYTSFGQRPDGKRYSTLPYNAVPSCPKNNFPIFKSEFSEEEIAILTPLIASDDYQQMVKSEDVYYRIWWLAKALPGAPDERLNYLFVASWNSDGKAEQKQRYQRLLIEEAQSILTSDGEIDGDFWLVARLANIQRELGDFQASNASLDKIDGVKARPTEPQEARAAEEFISALRQLNSERNISSEPVILIPKDVAKYRCEEAQDLTQPEKLWCAEEFPPISSS